MTVRCYYNLHKKCFSVLHKTSKGWRLFCHEKNLMLHNVTFKVYEAGRQRVIKEKKKNVHAFIEGTWFGNPVDLDPCYESPERKISYNPYKGSMFVDVNGNDIQGMEHIYLTKKSGFRV